MKDSFLKLLGSMRLRTKMLLLFGGGIGTILLAIGLIRLFGIPFSDIEGDYTLQERRVAESMQLIGDQQKTLLSLWFRERFGDLKVLTSAQEIKALLNEESRSNADDLAIEDQIRNTTLPYQLAEELLDVVKTAYGQYDSIELIGGSSKEVILSTTPNDVGRKAPYAELLFQEDYVYWKNKAFFYTFEGDKQATLLLAATVSSNGSSLPTAAIVFKIPSENFLQPILYAEKALGRTGEIILIDMQKNLLTPLRYDLPDTSIAEPMRYKLNTRSAEFAAWGVDGLIDAPDYRGIPVVAVIRHLRLTQDFAISMIVKRDQYEVYAPVRRSLWITLIISAVGIGLSIFLCFILARQLARPLEVLNAVAEKIKTGNLGARVPPVDGAEAKVLAHAFNTMADRIQQSQKNLELEVDERTRELIEANQLLRIEMRERREAEEKIRINEERFRLAMDATNDGLWEWDLVRGEVYYSPNFSRMLVYDPEKFKDNVAGWLDLVHPDDRQEVEAANKGCVNGDHDSFSVEFRMKAGDDKWRSILRRGRAVSRDRDGMAVRLIGTHVDITKRKEIEFELLQAQKMESIGRLAGGVAHDFNNMLGAILGHAELLLKDTKKDSIIYNDLIEIHGAAKRSAELTKQLLGFARRQHAVPQVIDINQVIDSMLKLLGRIIGENISLIWNPGDELYHIRIDPTQIDQILANLCVNARDAIDENGEVIIETQCIFIQKMDKTLHGDTLPGEYVRLTVSDNGSGIDDSTRQMLFEPFFTTKEENKGTGLGLAMIWGIVKQNRGFIHVISEQREGTHFMIYFPRYRGEVPRKKKVEGSPEVVGGKETILIVEDEEAILRMAVAMLEHLGYRVLPASSPGEAIEIAERNSDDIDLILTDVIMPEMNGKELSEKLTQLYPGLKTLFMSGYTADIIADQGVMEDGIDFIQKPFTMSTLVHKTQAVLGRRP